MKKTPQTPQVDFFRRRLLHTAALIIPIVAILPVEPVLAAINKKKRTLSFFHTHTNKKLAITYSENNRYIPSALSKINSFLSDFRSGKVHPIDPKLLDILFSLQCNTGSKGTFEVISGYRSPETNEKLRNRSNGVAKRSLHTKGQAIDIRLQDVNCKKIRDCAMALQCGGVGYYGKSNFVHLDTGRIRAW
jgi:uncharacterized protein YcbK (DUF882 family)